MSKKEKICGNLVDIHNESIFPAALEIENGKIVSINRVQEEQKTFITPGFVDAHIHVESSMLPPSEFARLAVLHGTVATVSDPHEIGNVLGIEGIEYMLENAKTVPLKFYFGAPSCVPATRFETSGAHLGPEEIRSLLSKKEIKYLSEVMNFPGVIANEPEVMAKIAIAKELNKKIDGHAPGLRGENLKKYISAGIQTDHECTTLAEALEKKHFGMKILIREGSAARNFDALFPLLLEDSEQCMLCCDDMHPDSLLKGHINLLVARAVKRGLDVIKALRAASWNAIQHYGLDVGALRVGDSADFLIIENLKDFRVLSTYIEGKCVASQGKSLISHVKAKKINRNNLTKKEPKDFLINAKQGKLKIIEAVDRELLTTQSEVEPLIKNGFATADPSRDILKITVVNRYMDKQPSIAFIKNFGLKKGAIASSVAHDSHNIIAIGTTDEELCQVVNLLIENQGGIGVVNGDKEECLPLPIAGLMSDKKGEDVGKKYEKIEALAKGLGSSLTSPFMTLSFMALLVIPRLKLSDLGLFDQSLFEFTDPFC